MAHAKATSGNREFNGSTHPFAPFVQLMKNFVDLGPSLTLRLCAFA
jgi:hypothetical protein